MFVTFNSLHFMSNIFLLNKASLKLSNSVAIFTPFSVLSSLPSIFSLNTFLTLIQQIQ